MVRMAVLINENTTIAKKTGSIVSDIMAEADARAHWALPAGNIKCQNLASVGKIERLSWTSKTDTN
jgi:hypothetical protein